MIFVGCLHCTQIVHERFKVELYIISDQFLQKLTKKVRIYHLDELVFYRKCVAGFSLILECFHMILLLYYEFYMHS